MFQYFKKGWDGELTFSQVIMGKYSSFIFEGGIAYIGFYLLLLVLLTQGGFSLTNVFLYPCLLYLIALYIWLLKAFWGSANHCSNPYSALLIRIFTLFLPLISIILFVLILLYYILSAILDCFN